MVYEVLVTVQVCAGSKHEAYGIIKHALFLGNLASLSKSRKAEIGFLDAEVTKEESEEDLEEFGSGLAY
jgi:hypothetical protein